MIYWWPLPKNLNLNLRYVADARYLMRVSISMHY